MSAPSARPLPSGPASAAGPASRIPATSSALSARRALERAATDLALRPLLFVTDFDGTISPLVLDPWGAQIVPAARRALRRLAGLADVQVVILSGRLATDVAARTRVGGATYLGNHGIERAFLPRRARPEGLVVSAIHALDEYLGPAQELADAVAQLVPEPWLDVERKPPSVTFHYRRAPDLAVAATRVALAVDRADPHAAFVRHPGRRALELRPPGAAAKGESLARLLDERRPAAAFVLGDDRSDAAAFATLREARAARRVRGLALAVRARAEEQPEVVSAADLVLASPAEAARFLGGAARLVAAATRFVAGTAAPAPPR